MKLKGPVIVGSVILLLGFGYLLSNIETVPVGMPITEKLIYDCAGSRVVRLVPTADTTVAAVYIDEQLILMRWAAAEGLNYSNDEWLFHASVPSETQPEVAYVRKDGEVIVKDCRPR